MCHQGSPDLYFLMKETACLGLGEIVSRPKFPFLPCAKCAHLQIRTPKFYPIMASGSGPKCKISSFNLGPDTHWDSSDAMSFNLKNFELKDTSYLTLHNQHSMMRQGENNHNRYFCSGKRRQWINSALPMEQSIDLSWVHSLGAWQLPLTYKKNCPYFHLRSSLSLLLSYRNLEPTGSFSFWTVFPFGSDFIVCMFSSKIHLKTLSIFYKYF